MWKKCGGCPATCKGHRSKKKSLLGILCILAGLLLILCCAPAWLIAMIVAFVLIGVGCVLIAL